MLTWLDQLLARVCKWLSNQGIGKGLPCLDLHGMGVKQALQETERFLREAQSQGVKRVRIVYGKGHHSPGGRGVLREVIPKWLANEGRRWVESFSPVLDGLAEEGLVEVIIIAKSGS